MKSIVGVKNTLVDLTLIIAGPQGGGIESAGQIALKTFVIKGYNVIGTREYHSNIMGAHSYYLMRVKDRRPGSVRLPVDALLALDAESVFTHFSDVREGGFIVYDPATAKSRIDQIQPMATPLKERLRRFFAERGEKPTVEAAIKAAEEHGVIPVGLPLKTLLKRVAEEAKTPPASVSKTVNTMGLAATLYLLGVEPEIVEKAIALQFARKEKVVKVNIIAARIAVEYVKEVIGAKARLPDGPHKGKQRMIASGNDVVGMGKIVAGLGFISYYPITPSSDEALYIEKHNYIAVPSDAVGELGYDKLSIVSIQTEDELAAVNMAIGAALAGARATTTTSGPGFSLMNEALSLAVEAEVPLVVTLWMRAGPSTGMPTRTGQQDVLHAIFSGHGDAPKIVIASGDHVEAYYDAIKAFNWAEKFQVPVIHLLDKYLASTMVSLDREDLDPEKIVIDRGKLVEKPGEGYKRYEITEDGISPRARVGDAVMYVTGLEHTPDGKATEDPVAREEMMFKRESKMKVVEEEIPEEDKAVLLGDKNSEIALVSFGSNKPIILDALELLRDEGVTARFVHVRLLSPFPGRLVAEILEGVEKVIVIEANLWGQLATLLRAYAGIKPQHSIVKINGRPFYDNELAGAIKRVLETGEERVVVRGGA